MDGEKVFDHEDNIRFIKMVEKSKILYDREYGKGIGWQARMKIVHSEWEKIAIAFDMPDKECAMRRWRYFRDRFVREYRAITNNNSPKLNYTPWLFYDYMTFIINHVRSRRSLQKTRSNNSNNVELVLINTETSSTEYRNEAENDDDVDDQATNNDYMTDSNKNDIFDNENEEYNNDDNVHYDNENRTNSCLKQEKLQYKQQHQYQNVTFVNRIKTEQQQEPQSSSSSLSRTFPSSINKRLNKEQIKTKRKRYTDRQNYNDDDEDDVDNNEDDPEHTFSLYVLSEMRQMPKKRRNQLKAMIMNFILNDDDNEDDHGDHSHNQVNVQNEK